MTDVTKDELVLALNKLDRNDDQHWTDDGMPRVDVLRALTGNQTLNRTQINTLVPGFNRTPVDAEADAVAAAAALVASPQGTPGTHAEDDDLLNLRTSEDFNPAEEPEINGAGVPLTEIEVKAILVRRVDDAEAGIVEAQAGIRRANDALVEAQKKATRHKIELNRRFPPLSAEENIKQHLASHGAILEASVAAQGDSGMSQLDIAMGRSNRRGWTRPVRPVIGGQRHVA